MASPSNGSSSDKRQYLSHTNAASQQITHLYRYENFYRQQNFKGLTVHMKTEPEPLSIEPLKMLCVGSESRQTRQLFFEIYRTVQFSLSWSGRTCSERTVQRIPRPSMLRISASTQKYGLRRVQCTRL